MSLTPPLRAPRLDGAVLAQPALTETGTLLSSNRGSLNQAPVALLGRPLPDLRRQAVRETVAAAVDYLQRGGEPIPPHQGTSLLFAGHQPELFHPGVWVKNFAINGLARRAGALPVNLVVDNDTVKSTALRLPTLASEHPDGNGRPAVRSATLLFDAWSGEVPYEEQPVHDDALFVSFADRALTLLAPWGFTPLLPDFWTEVRRQVERTSLLGERFAAARRSLERRWGCHNLEVPVSVLCRSESFAWFACHLLADLPRFHDVYNTAIHDYRRREGIRSKNHPAPDLAAEGDWREVPLWGWRAAQPRRGRLFARRQEQRVELRVGKDVWPSLPLGADPSQTIAAWLDLERNGFKVRSRALTNTLFVRLCIADLFIHGIGGGKYDTLTDMIMRRYFGIEPPAFQVLSATLLLPVAAAPVTTRQRDRLARELRDLHYNPQRHLPDDIRVNSRVAALLAGKQEWVERNPTAPPQRRERFQALRTVTEQLRPFVGQQEIAVQEQLAESDRELAANAILQRRDYAFCLFPEQKIRPFCQQFLHGGTEKSGLDSPGG